MSVRFKSAQNGQYMTCPDGISADSLIYCQAGAPLDFDVQGDVNSSCTFRVVNTGLFMSYRGSTGAMKLVADSSDAFWQLQKNGTVYGIKNLAYNEFVWNSGGEAYLTRHGDPTDTDSQWFVEGL